MKRYRQSAILDLLSGEAIASQDELRQRLRARGFHATQATISRDIKELRLVKRAADGAYQKPGIPPGDHGSPEGAVRRAVAEYLRRLDQVQQLLVLRTDPGRLSPWRLRSTAPSYRTSWARWPVTIPSSSSPAVPGLGAR